MVRNYKRKTDRGAWDKKGMVEAVSIVLNKGKSLSTVAEMYNVPKTTLSRWCQKAKGSGIKESDIRFGRYKMFTEEQEYKLKQYIKDMNLSLCELSSLEVRRLAFQFAEQNNIKHSFNKETRLAGHDWYYSFMKRHKDIKDTKLNTKKTSLGRYLNGCRYPKKFYEFLTDLHQFYKFPPHRIYSVNEAAFISIPNLTSKIISGMDKTALNLDFITIITCCNAAGIFIPPLMIFPANKENSEYINGCPPGTIIECHPSGSVQREIFFPKWFQHFTKHAHPSNTDPILLLLNGSGLHVKNVEFIENAKASNIHILSIPHGPDLKLNPLDLNFMEALKEVYHEEQSKWYQENQGQIITLQRVGGIFGLAYKKAATPSNAMKGFQATGIYPLNKSIVSNLEKDSEITSSNEELFKNTIFKSGRETINDNGEGTSSTQSKSFGLIIKGPSDINSAVDDSKELNFSLFSELMENGTSDTNYSCESVGETKVPLNIIFVQGEPNLNEIKTET